jgi:hypothetical protein
MIALRRVMTEILGEYCLREGIRCPSVVDSVFEAAAAVGLIGRFWRPKDGEMQNAVAVAGRPPDHRAREWWCHLPEQDRREVFDEACERVDDLAKGLSIIQKTRQWNWFARQLLLNRHELESVLFVMDCAPGARTLREALRDIDREAASLYAAWAPELRDDERFCAVSVEPGSWWPGDINS